MKKILKFAIPLCFMLGAIILFVSYDFLIKDRIDTVQVIAAKENIKFKEKITSDDLIVKTIKKDNAVKGAFKPQDNELVIGQRAAINITKGTQIYSDLIDTYNLVPNEKKGEFVAPIPTDWLFAVPGSLRKTYVADFYAIPDKDQNNIKSQTSTVQVDNSDEDNTKESPIIETNQDLDEEVMNKNKPVLKNVRVASVKDSSNSEVTETKENEQQTTGVISSMEIIANQKMVQTLRNYTGNGYKIYVVYKFER